ncbi:UNVERIFIED_CONTAM: Receptor-like serine/threonine-protein kinase SD1-8, partial [Sesamum angustifolium]
GRDFGWNLVTGIERYFLSWKSNDDPAQGEFTYRLDITGYPQLVLKRGDSVLHRLGPWNGMQFSGMPSIGQNITFTAKLYMNSSVIYFREDTLDRSIVSIFSLSPSGVAQRLTWVERIQEWVVYYNLPTDICDNFGLCGAHGLCSTGTSPACSCLDRFVPKDEQAWVRSDWSGGCLRRAPLNCTRDVFLGYSGIKMPDSQFTWFNEASLLKNAKQSA